MGAGRSCRPIILNQAADTNISRSAAYVLARQPNYALRRARTERQRRSTMGASMGRYLVLISAFLLLLQPARFPPTLSGRSRRWARTASTSGSRAMRSTARIAAGIANCFQPKTTTEISGGAGSFGAVGAPDNPARGLITSSAAHCDNGDWMPIPGYVTTPASAQLVLVSCRQWMEQHMALAVTAARAAAAQWHDRRRQIPTFLGCTFVGGVGTGEVQRPRGVRHRPPCRRGLLFAHQLGRHPRHHPADRCRQPAGPWQCRAGALARPAHAVAAVSSGLISGCFVLMPEFAFCNDGPGRDQARQHQQGQRHDRSGDLGSAHRARGGRRQLPARSATRPSPTRRTSGSSCRSG